MTTKNTALVLSLVSFKLLRRLRRLFFLYRKSPETLKHQMSLFSLEDSCVRNFYFPHLLYSLTPTSRRKSARAFFFLALFDVFLLKKRPRAKTMASNDYLSVIYTGSIVLFTLALKGAREIEFPMIFHGSQFLLLRLGAFCDSRYFFFRSIDRPIRAPWRRRNAGDERKTALLEKEREREDRE